MPIYTSISEQTEQFQEFDLKTVMPLVVWSSAAFMNCLSLSLFEKIWFTCKIQLNYSLNANSMGFVREKGNKTSLSLKVLP